MPKSLKSIGLISVFLILSSTALFATEQITITTYYPSPYGVYRELRSQRMAIGENYIKHDTVCWEGAPINCDGLGGQTMIPSANNVDLIVEGNVGIGTTAPEVNLDIVNKSSNEVPVIQVKTLLGAGYSARLDVRAVNPAAEANVGLWHDTTGVRSHGFYWNLESNSSDLTLKRRDGVPTPDKEVLRFLNSNGNVGIGTPGPLSTLDVSIPHAVSIQRTITAESVSGANRYGLGFKYWTNNVGATFKTITEYEGTNEYNTIALKDGNVGIGTTSPQAKLHIGGTTGTDGIMFPDGTLQTTAGSAVPRYKVKYRTTTNVYTLSGFSSPDVQYSLSSFGNIQGSDRSWPHGSYLFTMNVKVVNATTKKLYLGWVDNRVYFFLDGSCIAGPWENASPGTNINYNLSVGNHTVQIIYTAEGGDDYIAILGEIVDNVDVFYRNS